MRSFGFVALGTLYFKIYKKRDKVADKIESALGIKMSEDGFNPSVEQRQLPYIARALSITSAISLVGEATATVDMETNDHATNDQISVQEQNYLEIIGKACYRVEIS